MELWWAPLTVSAVDYERLADTLSPQERQRAQAARRAGERERLAVSRGWLRVLLGQRLDIAPRAVEIVQREQRKPALAAEKLQFNASRSGDLALYALSEAVRVGVDVEFIDPSRDIAGIAERFFAPGERAALAALAPSELLAATYRCWTRKEAVLKGIGIGLGVEPASVESWSAGDGATSVAGWRVERVDLDRRYAAGVAGEESCPWVATAPRRLRWSSN